MNVIVYSHIRFFSESLAKCLEVHRDFARVHVSYCRQSLRNDIRCLSPNFVLFDLRDEDAIGEARNISEQCPDVRLLALAAPETANDVLTCISAGFISYIPHDATIDELCAVMRRTLKGESSCHPKIVSTLIREIRKQQSQDVNTFFRQPLTNRESEVMDMIARDFSNKEIANQLLLSVSTVKNHLHNIFSKLQVKGRVEALARLRNDPSLTRVNSSVPLSLNERVTMK